MGEDALAFLNDLEFPLSQPVEPTIGELQQFTPTIAGARRPRHRHVARRGAGEDCVLERLQGARLLVGGAASLLRSPRGARVRRGRRGARRLLLQRRLTSRRCRTGGTSRCSAAVLIPAVFSLDLIVLPLANARGLFPVAAALGGAGRARRGRRPRGARELRKARRGHVLRLLVPAVLRGARPARDRRADHPVGRRLLGLPRPDRAHRLEAPARVHEPRASASRCRTDRPPASACPTSSSSRSTSQPPSGSGCASSGRGSRWRRSSVPPSRSRSGRR